LALKTKKEKLLSHFGPQAHVFPWPACFFLLPALAQHQESAQSHAPPLSPTHGLLGAFPPHASTRPSFPAACFTRPLRHSPARPASAPRPSPAPRSASAFSTRRSVSLSPTVLLAPPVSWPRSSARARTHFSSPRSDAGPVCQPPVVPFPPLPFLSCSLSFLHPSMAWPCTASRAAVAHAWKAPHLARAPRSPSIHAAP